MGTYLTMVPIASNPAKGTSVESSKTSSTMWKEGTLQKMESLRWTTGDNKRTLTRGKNFSRKSKAMYGDFQYYTTNPGPPGRAKQQICDTTSTVTVLPHSQTGKTLMQHEALRGCMRLEPTNQISGGLRPIRDPTRLCPQLARELRQLSVRTRSKCDLITRKWDLPMNRMALQDAPRES